MLNKKNIFIIFRDLGLGGVQKKIVDISNKLVENPEIKVFIFLREKCDFSFESKLKKDRIFICYEPNIYIKIQFIRTIVFCIYLIFKSIRYRVDSVLCFMHHYALFGSLIKRIIFWNKIKFIIGQDGILSFNNTNLISGKKYPSKLLGFIFSNSNIIITQTEASKKDLIINYEIDNKKILPLPNWVISSGKYKKDAEKYHLIYLGRFESQKNLISLLEILHAVSKRFCNLKVCLVGSGSQESSLREFISINNLHSNIFIKKPTLDVYKYLLQSKLFILTSLFEGQSLSLLESMSLGVIPLVLKSPGIDEYITNGYNGYIETNEELMVDRILNLLSNQDLIIKLKKNSISFVNKYYGERNLKIYVQEILSD